MTTFSRFLLAAAVALVLSVLTASAASLVRGTLITDHIDSVVLRENRIGLDHQRVIKIYLPPHYPTSAVSYPVVYFLHNAWGSAERVFADGSTQRLIDRGWEQRVVGPFIFVAADFSSPTVGSLYENSPVSGRWLDFITDELVPYVDQHYRTLRKPESRAVVGDFFGGRGTLKLAMTRADLFGVAYAMHPVATGTGMIPWPEVEIDWPRLLAAKNGDEVGSDSRTRLFVSICQAFLPNPQREPFHCDFFKELKDGSPFYISDNASRLKKNFILEETLNEAVPNLRKLRGLAFDWARFDTTQDHVYANRQFSRKLEDLGIEHEAEEYAGTQWNKNWIPEGRFATRVLPFLGRRLVSE